MTTNMRYLRGAVVLGLLAISAMVVPARAGVGPSQWCTDSAGASTPILNTLVSLSAEVNPTNMYLCFSTTTYGDGGTAVTGGAIRVTDDGRVDCWRDNSPTVVALECWSRDDDPSSPGRTLDVTIRFQTTALRIIAGIEAGTPDTLVCLRDFTVHAAVTQLGPYDIGVCTP